MTEALNRFHVFYSWQSDSPKETNLNAIRNSLSKACKATERAMPTLKLVPDEATRDTSGSPNIALKILEKIEGAEIFIADITTITAKGAERSCPNPNVVFELGYAVATLGWDRVILLFNEAHGTFPADLPFDFNQNRVSRYRIELGTVKTSLYNLVELLKTAIEAVIKKSPKRPAELRGLSREKIAHERDAENMLWLMNTLHLPTLQGLTLSLPHSISDRAIWFYENFRGVVENSLFNVYDSVLKDAVERLYRSWKTALSHDNEYHDTPSGLLIFSSPGDMPLTKEGQVAWDAIEQARHDMHQALQEILDRLRTDYIEINIHHTNEMAWKDYLTFHKDAANMPNPRKAKSKRRKK